VGGDVSPLHLSLARFTKVWAKTSLASASESSGSYPSPKRSPRRVGASCKDVHSADGELPYLEALEEVKNSVINALMEGCIVLMR
jgi:hypothetical protein